MLIPYTTTATQLQRNYKKVVKKAKLVKDAIIVFSNSVPEGVYMDYDTYKRKLMSSNIATDGDKENKLLALAGTWTKQEADEFNRVVDEMNERIDPEDWK